MLYWNSSHILTKNFFSLSRQGEASEDKIDAGKTPRSVSLRGVWLRAVLACAESTPHSVSQLWISANFSKNHLWGLVSQRYWLKKKVWLRTVLACAESLQYLCNSEFLRNTILTCLSGAQIGLIHGKKCNKISWLCRFKSCFYFLDIGILKDAV